MWGVEIVVGRTVEGGGGGGVHFRLAFASEGWW